MNEPITFGGDTPSNYEQKCLCVLCLDTSGSMGGAPITALNKALQDFAAELQRDGVAKNRVEVCVITFDSTVTCVQEPSLIGEMQMPRLSVKGSTKLVDGMRAAIAKTDERKQYYKAQGLPYYRPFIVLMTDGGPDPGQDVNGLAAEIQDGLNRKKFTLFAVGTEGANGAVLNKISAPSHPLKLDGLNFGAFFQWLSNSLSEVSRSGTGQQVQFAPVDAWSGGSFSQTPV
ncbi:VWA domain-containing protein [Hymenobacter sp. BT18]|uniref:vWA domain-containing protein n=1 Tax=Hymenobacter sp. BT18 TaxID=2835648 RepID=UPI00143EA501|nr:VWA domain-containing protein [Hymenobacter sp. BT18]QIX62725.1 VWA domain-containing protein [Hymenobacter sp. BT18]